jgi:heme/copper-type cytochrome/quinol oxidase subunit 2
MFIKNKKLASILSFILVASPSMMVLAQDQPPIVPPPLGGPGPVQSPEEAISLLRQVLVWLATIFWILAFIFIFWSAFNYLTARGDQEKADKAKKMLWYAIVAIAIGLMAYAIPTFVDRFLRARA